MAKHAKLIKSQFLAKHSAGTPIKLKGSRNCLNAMSAVTAPACNSCNFKHTQKTWEINNETKETKPNDLISDEQSYYLKQTGGGGYNCYSLLTQFRTTRNPVTSSWQLVKGSISSIKVGLQPVIACPYTSDICRGGSISLSEIICHPTLHSLIEGKVNKERTI